jgi:hypothetical protein
MQAQFADKASFFIATVELPADLADLSCGLYGPIMGDAPVADADVQLAPRGTRAWPSRLVARPARPTRLLTVIAGPHDDAACVLYTAFGGPLAPQEPGDPGCKDPAASRAFWAEHALATGAQDAADAQDA